jgi:trigger factor
MPEQQEEKATPKNTVTIEQAGPCKKKVIVEIPRETIKKATDDQYATFSREALVPGFRKGHAPRRLLEKRFGKDIDEQIKLKMLADACDAAIKESKLDILREPDINHEKVELPAEGPLKFDFEVEVRPEFELPALEGIAVNKVKAEVTDAHVEREIEMLCKWSGAWTPKEKGSVEPEDQVVADVMLNIEGVGEQKLDNAEILVRHQGLVGDIPVEELEEILVGAKTGDVKTAEVTVPKTFFKEDLRGKKVDMKITVKEVKYLKPAEMNQELITKLGVASEEELRKNIKERLHVRLETQAKTDMADQVYKYLLDNTTFDLPVEVVADQTVAILRRQYMNLMMQGLQREVIDQHVEQLKNSSEEQARTQLKVYFIMDKISDKLGIQTTEEEINGHIAQLAIQKKIRPERLKDEMTRDGSLDQFKLQVREQKCVAKILETAKITDVDAPVVSKAEAKHHEHKHPASPKASAASEHPKRHKVTEKPALGEGKSGSPAAKPKKKPSGTPAKDVRVQAGKAPAAAKKHAEKPKAEEKTDKKHKTPIRKKKT